MSAAEIKSALFASVGCLLGMLAVHETNKLVYTKYDYKVGCPPSGPLACLLFCMPKAPASQPKTVLLSHGIAVLAALVAVAVHEFIPVLDVPKPVVGLMLSILAMTLAKALNPPAAAYAAALSGSGTTLMSVLTGPGTLGALVLIVVQQVYFKAADAVSGGGAKSKKA